MVVTDPIADMLARMKNALITRKRYVVMPSSKLKVEVARVLRAEGFIEHFDVSRDRPQPMLRIQLKYSDGNHPVVSGMERVSKPGKRVYTKRQQIPLVLSGMGVALLSTPRGVMTGKKAYRLGLGGEVLCFVW
ncbi:MAG: 30S ribosomal protein S8 [Chloroflexi bacterium ADurb.Bin180]|nr:MAG: 30S ribosomal protein S8 [Chloroflexi bacterium ADurb.Bin180]HOU23889.1 30S ribosomal protein S8 [Anaerolineae bacterium]HQJ50676.1 30S ribosomal protein S8 [Anaerolineae bacterium]